MKMKMARDLRRKEKPGWLLASECCRVFAAQGRMAAGVVKKKSSKGGKNEAVVVDFAERYAKVVQYEKNKRERGKEEGSNWRRGKTSVGSARGTTGPASSAAGVLELRDVRREVETLGAAGLGKKQAREWKQQVYSTLGAKADKMPRIPARIGLGMAKKKLERERKARELARETGMLSTPKKAKGKRRK